MKQNLGNLALILGVIVSSLAAAEGQRVSKRVAVDSSLAGQVLHTRVSSTHESDHPDQLVWLDRSLEADTELDGEMLSWIESLGQESIVIRRRPVDTTVVSIDEALGRVFANPTVLEQESEEIQVGRIISPDFIQRLEASGLTKVRIEGNSPVLTGESTTPQREFDWNLEEPLLNPEGAELLNSLLREKVSLPVQLKADSYIDADVLARMRESGITEVEVKIPREWSWQSWESRWIFMIGIGITLLGVLLKRSKSGADADSEEQMEVARVGSLLQELESTITAITSRVDEMPADQIHEALDPVLLGPVYHIAEGRNAIRRAHGVRVFASVMDAFSRGERKLNRTWSAAVDGYADEARRSLHSALPALREAREALPGTRAPHPSGFESGFDENPAGMPLPPDVPIDPGGSHWTDE